MEEKDIDECGDRRRDKWKTLKEVLVGLAVTFIGAYVLSIAAGIGDIKEKTSMMSVDISWLKTIQNNQTQALSGVNVKMDELSTKIQALSLKIAMEGHAHKISVVDRCVKRIASK